MACSSPANIIPVGTIQQPTIDSWVEVDQVNRIAFVNPNGDLFTVDPDGGGLAQLTGALQAEGGPEGGIQSQSLRMNEYYAWPTWSADGMKLAASRVLVEEDGIRITLEVLDSRTGRSETVYENTQTGLVADGAPHYIYWAPAGDQLSFLASTKEGLSLFRWDGTPGNQAEVIFSGGPLYYLWTKDASGMVLHI